MGLKYVVEFCNRVSLESHAHKGEEKSSLHTYLLELYKTLSIKTQNKIENEFTKLLQENEIVCNVSLHQFLENHKEDFIIWRYLDNVSEKTKSELNQMQIVICAILNVYEK